MGKAIKKQKHLREIRGMLGGVGRTGRSSRWMVQDVCTLNRMVAQVAVIPVVFLLVVLAGAAVNGSRALTSGQGDGHLATQLVCGQWNPSNLPIKAVD